MEGKFLSGILMTLLSVASLAMVLRGLQITLQKTGWERSKQKNLLVKTVAIVFLWMILVGLLAANGFFTNFSKMPPRPILVIVLPMVVMLFIAFSKTGTALIKTVPPHWLIAMQAFRILVEILLWRAFLQNLLPIQMTFEGNNFDGLSGVLAIPFAFLIKKKWSPVWALVYNIIGLLLLVNILVIAVLSMPTPLRYFMNEPPNTIVGEFPFIYLPAVLVVIALALHIFSLRQLWLLKKK